MHTICCRLRLTRYIREFLTLSDPGKRLGAYMGECTTLCVQAVNSFYSSLEKRGGRWEEVLHDITNVISVTPNFSRRGAVLSHHFASR